MSQRLQHRIRKISNLSSAEKLQMWKLFSRYYSHLSEQTFFSDLNAKQVAIVVKSPDGRIVGFSTLMEINIDGLRERVFFSGDTIVEEEYWGRNLLAFFFGLHLLTEKVKHPFRPIYWNLISKGYKTYLLLANNFIEYYPRFDQETPEKFQRMIDVCGERLYPGKFNAASGCIEFSSAADKERLKQNICEITAALSCHPKIAFFEKKNPNWRNGDELVCIGRFEIAIFPKYINKRVQKLATRAWSAIVKPKSVLNEQVARKSE